MAAVQRVRLAYNNVYLVEDGEECAVVDTGPDYAGADGILSETVGARSPDTVLVTHGHVDHAGLGRWWQERGVTVLAGAADRTVMESPAARMLLELERLEAFAQTCGAPVELQVQAIGMLARRRESARLAIQAYPPASPPPRWPTGLRYRPFSPNGELSDHGSLQAGLVAIAVPGHTPGNFVFVHPNEGWLFSGDQLLPGMTPTPALQLAPEEGRDWRYRSLPAFVASLRKLAAMRFSRAFPGHGDPFDDVAAGLHANLSVVEERSERLLEALRGAGPCSVYQAAVALYPRALRRRFWQIISTIQGQLDLLEQEGRARPSPLGWVVA